MSILSAIPIVGKILDGALGVIDKAVTDKDLRNKLKADLQSKMLSLDFSAFEKEIEAKAQIITAEIQGKNWLQRNWRPILMMTIVAIVANNYLVYPYLSMFTEKAVVLELPGELYTLMTVGVGGYIVGRSGEKIAKSLKAK